MKKIFLIILIITVVSFLTIIAAKASVRERNDETQYINLSICDGDSLWVIASKYKKEDKNIREYINEIKNLNGMKNDKLITGEKIVIPIMP